MKTEVFHAALAGLLHDVGKVAHRAGVKPSKPFSKDEYGPSGYHAVLSDDFVSEFIPKKFQAGLLGVLQHHKPLDVGSKIIQWADWWSSGERRMGEEMPQEDVQLSRLIPVAATVELESERQEEELKFRFPVAAWSLSKKGSFPENENEPPVQEDGEYPKLWRSFLAEINKWKQNLGDQWEDQDPAAFITTLKAVMQKYFWCVPSATPWQSQAGQKRSYPDVSLIDHARLTSAIAACLADKEFRAEDLDQLTDDQEVLLLARGDISGIQNFIFRVNRPESETSHLAKRLRGRSFYLSLLNKVLVYWLIDSLELPSTCVLFVGGGKFDLLLPLTKKEDLEKLIHQFNAWVMDAFQGELSIQVVAQPIKPLDFKDMSAAYLRLEAALQKAKQKKWAQFIGQDHFFLPRKQQWQVCKVCQLTPMDQAGTCALCAKHEDIGKCLPHTKALVFCKGKVDGAVDGEKKIPFIEPFGLTVVLAEGDEDIVKLFKSGAEVKKILTLNDFEHFIYPHAACSVYFLANTTPKALKPITYEEKGEKLTIKPGEVCTFELMAKMNEGAHRLGILKADVDRLGLIMSVGLLNPKQGKFPTISRIASLSSSLDWFFCGYLNTICKDVSDEYIDEVRKNKEADQKLIELLEKVENVFYMMYAGGDDLFVIGPWYAVIKLADKIRSEFHEFCGKNPNLTLSAGYVQVKPRYPVQKFANLVDEAEKNAKEKGRNKITLFGEALSWQKEEETSEDYRNLEKLMSFADILLKKINNSEDAAARLSKNIVYDLGQVQRRYFMKADGRVNPMWKPRLLYSLVRRLKGKKDQTLIQEIFAIIGARTMLVPVSIVSLKLRKE